MNEKSLKSLVGQTLTEAIEVHDYVQFAFGEGTMLSVFNPIQTSPTSANFEELIGVKISAVEAGETNETITFETGVALQIDLSDGAFSGPEAMTLHRIGLPLLVWS